VEVLAMARGWWVLGLRGLIAIVFGVLTLVWPIATLEVLMFIFGAYVLADGILALTAAARSSGTRPWATLVLEGVIGISLGMITFASPEGMALALVYLIAGWSVVVGVLEIGAAIRLRRDVQGEFWLGLAGALSVLFGIVLMFAPVGACWRCCGCSRATSSCSASC